MLLALVWISVALATPSSSVEEPFWRSKERVYERIKNREVIVSVSSRPLAQGARHRLVITGGGQVAAPCGFVFATAQEYEALARASGYVEKVSYRTDSGVMDFTLAAYGLTTEVALKLAAGDRVIKYEVLSGPLKGMAGRFDFLAADLKCDVGMAGEFTYEKFPIPEFFLRFGLEVMLQRMAIGVRRFSEEKFKGQRPGGAK